MHRTIALWNEDGSYSVNVCYDVTVAAAPCPSDKTIYDGLHCTGRRTGLCSRTVDTAIFAKPNQTYLSKLRLGRKVSQLIFSENLEIATLKFHHELS